MPDEVMTNHPDLHARVATIIEQIRPAVKDDGGDVELVGITDDYVVQVRFHGACVGCPSSSMTLHMGIERSVKQMIPQITAVEQVE